MAALERLDVNFDANRVPAVVSEVEAKRRADRDAAVARYLARRGYADLIPVLGLERAAPAEAVVAR